MECQASAEKRSRESEGEEVEGQGMMPLRPAKRVKSSLAIAHDHGSAPFQSVPSVSRPSLANEAPLSLGLVGTIPDATATANIEQAPTGKFKSGKFSAIEHRQLENAIENYRLREKLDPEQLTAKIMAKWQHKDKKLWEEIASAVPQRDIKSLTAHVQRNYNPLAKLGEWSPHEDSELVAAVATFGTQWKQVSVKVGRTAEDCRDRYRNNIRHNESRAHGKWSPEEEAQLTEIVTRLKTKGGSAADFWTQVSSLMGHRRGRQQCQQKWTDSLQRKVKNQGVKPIWTEHDVYTLVRKIDALDVEDDTEINFKELACPGWDFWSGHALQRRWSYLKTLVPDYKEKSHRDIIASLREQPAIIKKRHRKSEASSVESNAGFGSSNFARGTTVEIESEDEESTDKQ